jgi:hypothetical protein
MRDQVMSTIYPTSVKQKLIVNALLALCPVMLWVAHSIAGARESCRRARRMSIIRPRCL